MSRAARKPDGPAEVVDLSALIQRHRDATGESYAEIAARAELSKPYVHKVATKGIEAMPKPETIRAIARGLSLNEAVVRDACLVSTGLLVDPVPSRDPAVEAHVAAFANLSAHDREIVENLVDSLSGKRRRHSR